MFKWTEKISDKFSQNKRLGWQDTEKESVIENSGWTSNLRNEYVWEKTSNAWNRTIIKDIAKEKIFELNEGLNLQTMKSTVGCRNNEWCRNNQWWDSNLRTYWQYLKYQTKEKFPQASRQKQIFINTKKKDWKISSHTSSFQFETQEYNRRW